MNIEIGGIKMNIEIGDYIKFRSPTRFSDRTATRQVTGFYGKRAIVRYQGWSNFMVRCDEILEVIKQ